MTEDMLDYSLLQKVIYDDKLSQNEIVAFKQCVAMQKKLNKLFKQKPINHFNEVIDLYKNTSPYTKSFIRNYIFAYSKNNDLIKFFLTESSATSNVFNVLTKRSDLEQELMNHITSYLFNHPSYLLKVLKNALNEKNTPIGTKVVFVSDEIILSLFFNFKSHELFSILPFIIKLLPASCDEKDTELINSKFKEILKLCDNCAVHENIKGHILNSILSFPNIDEDVKSACFFETDTFACFNFKSSVNTSNSYKDVINNVFFSLLDEISVQPNCYDDNTKNLVDSLLQSKCISRKQIVNLCDVTKQSNVDLHMFVLSKVLLYYSNDKHIVNIALSYACASTVNDFLLDIIKTHSRDIFCDNINGLFEYLENKKTNTDLEFYQYLFAGALSPIGCKKHPFPHNYYHNALSDIRNKPRVLDILMCMPSETLPFFICNKYINIHDLIETIIKTSAATGSIQRKELLFFLKVKKLLRQDDSTNTVNSVVHHIDNLFSKTQEVLALLLLSWCLAKNNIDFIREEYAIFSDYMKDLTKFTSISAFENFYGELLSTIRKFDKKYIEKIEEILHVAYCEVFGQDTALGSEIINTIHVCIGLMCLTGNTSDVYNRVQKICRFQKYKSINSTSDYDFNNRYCLSLVDTSKNIPLHALSNMGSFSINKILYILSRDENQYLSKSIYHNTEDMLKHSILSVNISDINCIFGATKNFAFLYNKIWKKKPWRHIWQIPV